MYSYIHEDATAGAISCRSQYKKKHFIDMFLFCVGIQLRTNLNRWDKRLAFCSIVPLETEEAPGGAFLVGHIGRSKSYFCRVTSIYLQSRPAVVAT